MGVLLNRLDIFQFKNIYRILYIESELGDELPCLGYEADDVVLLGEDFFHFDILRGVFQQLLGFSFQDKFGGAVSVEAGAGS